jgi:hypothetical protein
VVNKIGGNALSPAVMMGSSFVEQIPGRPKKNSLMKLFKSVVMNQNPPLGMVLSDVKYSESWFLLIPFLAGMHEVSMEQGIELLKEFDQQPPSADAVLEKLEPVEVEQIEATVNKYLYRTLKSQHPYSEGR